jgi:hypothetical protein
LRVMRGEAPFFGPNCIADPASQNGPTLALKALTQLPTRTPVGK